MLATKQAEREINRINRKIDDMGKSMGKSFGGMGGGTDKVRALGSGLSKATVKADEFSKSLEASNARVIAFGASAGLIMGVERALKAMVTSAIKVEKAMMDVSVVMQVSNRQLEQFGKGMFRVAKETAQGFDAVSEAATELARQGLGMEKTLSRTKDALILTRLTGMNAADSVKALTAAVNSFNKEGVTSTQVVNRMAKVDAAFAVSSEDLAKSISRVGASAISAGVGMNELMAITTAVQQKTARGGAVIGNAFKTIFTRIQRSDVQKKLRDMGIASTDMQGRMLNGMRVLENMAGGFDKLTKAQQASLAENVAGVFQVNILKAALSDLTSQTSNYKGALDAANSATNEAYQRNEQLNQTLDALSNRTLANLTKAGSTIGGATLEPAIRKVLNSVNTVIDAFSEGGRFAKFGSTIGEGLLSGIGNFIKGPGLIIVGTAFMKLGLSLAKFAGSAFKDLMGLNAATKQRAALEEAVIAHIASEPALLAKVRTGTLNVLAVEKDILATVRLANAERSRIQAYAAPLAGALVGRGMRAGSKGVTVPGGAAGFVPNFASPAGERAAAAAGGYRAGSIKTMNQPGAGTMMYNSAETVKKFPGMSQSAIMPPQSSPAGAGYRSAFGAAHGFDPYAAGGFIPNFRVGRPPQAEAHKFKRGEEEGFAPGKKGNVVNMNLTLPSKKKDMGIITEEGSDTTPISFSQNIMHPKTGIPELASGMKSWVGKDGRRVGQAMLRVSGIPVVPVFPISQENMRRTGSSSKKPTQPGKYLQKSLNRYSERLSQEMFGTTDIQRDFDVEGLSKGTMGDIFEEGVRVAVGGAKNDDRLAAFDYMGKKFANSRLIGFFNRQGKSANLVERTKIEAKIGAEAAVSGNIPKKMINDPDVGYHKKDVMKLFQDEFRAVTGSKGAHLKGTTTPTYKTKAMGFIPNFSALTDAVGREMQAGVPASAIRVGSSPALRSSGNPKGVGVYNTIHEPGGLNQGISRARSSGINPKSHGVPNYALTAADKIMGGVELSALEKNNAKWDKITKEGADSAKTTAGAATKFEKAANGLLMASMMLSMAGPAMGEVLSGGAPSGTAAWSAGANILSMGVMGLAMTGGNPLGAAGGLALGAITSMGDLKMGFGEEGEIADAKAMKDKADALAEGLQALTLSLEKLENVDFMTVSNQIESYTTFQEKLLKIQRDLLNAGPEGTKARELFYSDPEIQRVMKGDFSNLNKGSFESVGKKIEEVQVAALATIGGGGKSTFRKKMGEFNLLERDMDNRQATIDLARARGTLLEEGYFGADTLTDFQRKDRLKARETVLKAFPSELQTAMRSATDVKRAGAHPGQKGRTGVDILKQYEKRMDAGDYQGAIMAIAPLLRATNQENMADSLMELATAPNLNPTHLKAALEGKVLPGGATNPVKGDYKSGVGAFRLLDRGRKSGVLSMLFKAAPPQAVVDPALARAGAKNKEDALASSLMALHAPIEEAGVRARGAKFELAGNIAGRKRALDLAKTGRTQEAQLAAAQGMFGERLIDKTGWLKQQGLFEQYSARMGDIGDTRDLTIKGSKQTARAAYLKKLEAGEITSGMRVGAQSQLATMEGMTIDEKKALREGLRQTEARNATTIGAAKIEYLTSVIDAEVKAREISEHQSGEAAKEYGKNAKQLASNTKHLKKMEEASHHFYEGAFLYNLRKQANVLEEQIQFQEKEVAAGRLNVEVLTESRMKFADLNQQLTGNGNHLEVLNERFKKILSGPLSDKEITDATIAAQKGLNQQVRGRQLSGAGAAGIISNAQAAYDANQITSSELRAIKANARLNAPGATGNPMEAFRDQFLYNGRDAMLDFENGVVNVADTMKSSFSQAFRSLTSGASTAKEAFAGMAVSILDSISDMSGQMATKMLFNQMNSYFGAQGGLVPRYNQGGVVTGGSGHKDDVLSLMSGGEFVIKKSSAQKIGYGTLNAINSGGARGYAEGGSTAGAAQKGPGMGSMMAVSAGASALSGIISQVNQPDPKKPWRGENYGFGRGKYGYFGGPEHDAGRSSSIAGGGGSAQVSLNKGFAYYRRDPQTGRLISERARPTEGRFEVSSALSLRGRLGEGDPQTSRMFSKEQSMGNYQDYLFDETKRRKDVVKAHEKMKQGRRISAWANAAMLIGGSYMMGKTTPNYGPVSGNPPEGWTPPDLAGYGPSGYPVGREAQTHTTGWGQTVPMPPEPPRPPGRAAGGSVGGSAAMLMGGEYVMSPQTVRTYGTNFMSELNRGSVPQMAGGGFVGGQGVGGGMISGGDTNNNVNINVNVDKRGSVKAEAGGPSGENSDNAQRENTLKQTENNKDLGKALQTVVLQELIRQQRPGGLLTKG
jgi:TP901 family phage tail tape measure protein